MPVVPFIPMIAQGVGAAVGHFGGKAAKKSAEKRSAEEQTALGGAQGAAGAAQQASQQLLGQGAPWMQNAGNYYRTLMSGNRAAMSQAVAGPTAQITDLYRGATRDLERSGLQGATRDVASADLNRDRASRLAGLTTGVQPWASQALGQLGAQSSQIGAGLANVGGNIYANLLSQGAHNREYAREQGGRAASEIGKTVIDVTNKLPWDKWFGKKPPTGGQVDTSIFNPSNRVPQGPPLFPGTPGSPFPVPTRPGAPRTPTFPTNFPTQPGPMTPTQQGPLSPGGAGPVYPSAPGRNAPGRWPGYPGRGPFPNY